MAPDQFIRRRYEAEETEQKARDAKKDAEHTADETADRSTQAQKECKDARPKWWKRLDDEESGITNRLLDSGDEPRVARARMRMQDASETEEQASHYQQIVVSAKDKENSAKSQTDALKKLDDRLRDTQNQIKAFAQDLPASEAVEDAPTAVSALPHSDDAEEQLTRLEQRVRRVRDATAEWQNSRGRARDRKEKSLREGGAGVQSAQLYQYLSGLTHEEIEAQAEQILLELSATEAGLHAKLEGIEPEMDIIVGLLTQVTDQVVSGLSDVGYRAQLPGDTSHPPQSLFAIAMPNRVREQSEIRRRVRKSLVDWMQANGQSQELAALIFQAARAVLDTFTIKLRHLDSRNLIPIEQTGKWSGGQRLTVALILYAAIARIRTNAQHTVHPALVLLLDNPFGTSSLPRYVEMVQTISRRLNIQLLAFTAINDYGVLNTMPVRLVLRNREDAVSGQKVVMLADSEEAIQSPRLLTAVRQGTKRVVEAEQGT